MALNATAPAGVDRGGEILTDEALAAIESLHRSFAGRRQELLGQRDTAANSACTAGIGEQELIGLAHHKAAAPPLSTPGGT
jgi:malate synthase